MKDLVRIQVEDFSIEEEIARVKMTSSETGAVAVFLGTARDISKGEKIMCLEFEHYPEMAEKKLREIRTRALDNFNIIEMGVVHRTGKIEIGENIVLIVVSSRHRNDAFMACEWAISELKRTTPIWKREKTENGEVWVEEHP